MSQQYPPFDREPVSRGAPQPPGLAGQPGSARPRTPSTGPIVASILGIVLAFVAVLIVAALYLSLAGHIWGFANDLVVLTVVGVLAALLSLAGIGLGLIACIRGRGAGRAFGVVSVVACVVSGILSVLMAFAHQVFMG